MGFIKIDPELQQSDAIADFFSSLIQEERNILPKLNIQSILLGKTRPGLSSDSITASIISRFKEAGIPTGPIGEGSPNAMEILVKIIIEELVDAIQNEMRVDTAVDIGMQVESLGASPSGPISSHGSNLAPHTAIGIPR